MKKAEMLEETRCQLSLMLEAVKDKSKWYDVIIDVLKLKVPHYKTIQMYLTTKTTFQFYKQKSDTEEEFVPIVPFGEEMLSIVAARGDISCEFEPDGQRIYIPFYKGHFLLGELVIKTNQFIDDTELNFIKHIQEILNEAPQL